MIEFRNLFFLFKFLNWYKRKPSKLEIHIHIYINIYEFWNETHVQFNLRVLYYKNRFFSCSSENRRKILTLIRLDNWRRLHGFCRSKYTGNEITSQTKAMTRIALIAVWTQRLSILKFYKKNLWTMENRKTLIFWEFFFRQQLWNCRLLYGTHLIRWHWKTDRFSMKKKFKMPCACVYLSVDRREWSIKKNIRKHKLEKYRRVDMS